MTSLKVVNPKIVTGRVSKITIRRPKKSGNGKFDQLYDTHIYVLDRESSFQNLIKIRLTEYLSDKKNVAEYFNRFMNSKLIEVSVGLTNKTKSDE